MAYRKANLSDIPELCQIRKKQLIDEGIAPNSNIDDELTRYFSDKLADGSLVEWVVEEGGKIIATAAIAFFEFPPTYTNPSGLKGYITNMYTSPAYRGQGMASSLLERLTSEAKKRGVHKLWLGASKLGRPVNRRFGFSETQEWMEMEL